MVWTLAALAVILLATATMPVTAQQDAVPPEVIAKNLAQNVLGQGTVRWVRVSRDRQQIAIAWDAVLYRPHYTADRNRDQLKGEAELATGSIMGVMKPDTIRFTILLRSRALATGRRTRDGEFTIKYAKELGG